LDNNEIWTLFDQLYADLNREDAYPQNRPLLAHYTSIATLEAIMKSNEMWLGNPLFMNDYEELRFGINEAAISFRLHQGIRSACKNQERYEELQKVFENCLTKISNDGVFDVYVMCFSEHDRDTKNTDGLLSMWRGYGANGTGAAIVFDTQELSYVENSPLMLAQVEYGSKEKRLAWIDGKLDKFALLLAQSNLSVEQFYLPITKLLHRILLFALFSKHDGFMEEREWRLAYVGAWDDKEKLKSMIHYSIGENGIQPKLKLKIGGIEGVIAEPISLEKIITQIILGPSISNHLSLMTVKRMLEILKRGEIAKKVKRSSTPFRSTHN
jgi:hypothetical protein